MSGDAKALAHKYRFLRPEGGGVDALQLAGLMPAVGDFVHVRAITPGDYLGHDPERRVITPDGNQVQHGKVKALCYEILSIGADAQAKRPELQVGHVVDQLASSADMVNPDGSRVCAYVPVDFIPYAMDPIAAGEWFDDKLRAEAEAAAEAKADEAAARAAIEEERKRVMAASH